MGVDGGINRDAADKFNPFQVRLCLRFQLYGKVHVGFASTNRFSSYDLSCVNLFNGFFLSRSTLYFHEEY